MQLLEFVYYLWSWSVVFCYFFYVLIYKGRWVIKKAKKMWWNLKLKKGTVMVKWHMCRNKYLQSHEVGMNYNCKKMLQQRPKERRTIYWRLEPNASLHVNKIIAYVAWFQFCQFNVEGPEKPKKKLTLDKIVIHTE